MRKPNLTNLYNILEKKSFLLKNPSSNHRYPSQLFVIKQTEEIKLNEHDLNHWLSNEELISYEKIGNTSLQKSYFYGKKVAKIAILELTKIINPKEISIRSGIYGQPIVHCLNFPNLQVSISHSKTYAAAIAFFEECPMGIDIEEVAKIKEESVRSQMTSREMIKIIPNINSEYGGLCLWTAKEALSKVLKTGLQIDFSILEIGQTKLNSNVVEGSFINFIQYQFISFLNDDFIFSVVLPKTINQSFK